MRVIRTIDPLSGKTMQRKITLSSTSGVNVTQHEELPKSTVSDVTIASNQLTRAVYDVRDTMRETNVINYEISKKLKKGMDNAAASTSDAISIGYQANVDALNGIKDEIVDFKNTGANTTTFMMDNINTALSNIKLDTDVTGVETSIDSVKAVLDDTNELLEGIRDQDRMSADNMTVTIGERVISVNQAFTDIFSLLNGINEKLTQILPDEPEE